MAPAKIADAITDPNKQLDPRSEVVTAIAGNGSKFTGIIRNEDNSSISLQSIDASFHFLPKSTIVRVDHSSRSLMPDNYKSTFAEAELNNLATYLPNAR